MQHLALSRALPAVLAPALCLAAEVWFGQAAFRGTALVLILAGTLAWRGAVAPALDSAAPAAPQDRAGLARAVDRWIAGDSGAPGSKPVCLAVNVHPTYTRDDGDAVAARTAEVLRTALRRDDILLALDPRTFLIVLLPPAPDDLESLLQVAARLQSAARQPDGKGSSGHGATLSIGLAAWSSLAEATGEADGAALIDAAERALQTARRAGEGTIRVDTPEQHRSRRRRAALALDPEEGLNAGQIRPWFQPQLSTDTGLVSGFEALARWVHPRHGVVPPADFLPVLQDSGLWGRFTDHILQQAMLALQGWDRAGHEVPAVSVNLGQTDLDDPWLTDRILWQLDRYDLAPQRLSVEILESVIAGEPEAAAARNLGALAAAGCGIDLDDFGTGHASITSLRRFPVARLKIDRSFVRHVDSDPAQQQMVAAILSMAERLGLDTLAEGVETPAEHARLAELGCGHVQGYALGRPMPPEETAAWLIRHRTQMPTFPDMGRRSG